MSDKFWLEEATKRDYADPNISLDETVAAIVRDFKLEGAKPVILEIGCGYGRLLGALQKTYPKAVLVGIDINHKVLEHAKALTQGVKYFATTQIDIKSNAIFSVQVFQHISYEAKQLYIHKAAKALKKGGTIRIQFVEGHHANDQDLTTYASRYDFDKWAAECGLKITAYDSGLVSPTWAWVTLTKG